MNEKIRGNKIGWGMEHSLPLRHRSFSFWGKALAKLAADLPWALGPVGIGGSLGRVTTAHLKPESFKSHCIIHRICIKWATLCSS